MIYIFDIDGTLADLSQRLHLIQSQPPDWEAFFMASGADQPIWDIITIARALRQGSTIILSSGRAEKSRAITVAWMNKYRVLFDALYMRKDGDHREDNVVKSELLDQILAKYPGIPIAGIFEDRQQVVDMYRARGFRVLQVAKGDF